MTFYALSLLISAISIPSIGGVVCFKNTRNLVNRFFFFYCIILTFWVFGCFMESIVAEKSAALFWDKVVYTGSILTPAIYLNFIFIFLKKREKRYKIIIGLSYCLASIFLAFNYFSILRPYFIASVIYKYSLRYVATAGPMWHVFFFGFYGIHITYVFFVLLSELRLKTGIKRIQMKYWLAAYVVMITAGLFYFLLLFDIYCPAIDAYLLIVYAAMMAYAIVRYRLMDVTVAITRTGIFVAVYSLVLGMPFVVAHTLRPYLMSLIGEKWWMGPLVLSTFLATTGPFIYLYIQRRAEDALLREQRRYQRTLRQASSGMTRIRDLRKLLNLIVHIITRTVRIKNSSIFLLVPNDNRFVLHAHRDRKKSPPPAFIDADSLLIKKLKDIQEPIVYEEIKQQAQDFNDKDLLVIQGQMELLGAAVAVPSLVEQELIGFIVMGEKISGQIYSPDDLSVFSVLANQSALAIENAQFYEDIKETQTQLFQAEKMATIGTMADGLSHQINNRFHALGMIAADTLDTIKLLHENSSPEEVREAIQQISHALERVKENVKQGGEVVHGLLKYSRAGESGFNPVKLDVLIDAALDMAQYKVKLSQIDLIRDYAEDIPCIKGNLVQLQEVFFNLIDNAYDAIMQRREELKEPNYRGNVTIQAVATDSILEIRFIDNGMGVKDSDQERLFTPFHTTKASSKKGTGLGLYVIQKIIVNNHKGRISFESEYGTGTMFIMKLPAVRE
ncbi:ATP-binding protein [Candidatus Omnitrophota bacterium]